MNITQPEWKLKSQRCPCYCGGEGFLIFISCPNCGHIALLCDEVGTVFSIPDNLLDKAQPSRLDISEVAQLEQKCPKCSVYSVSEFGCASSTEIQAVGFNVGEYD